MTDIDVLTENSWDAEREEAAAYESDLAAREELLESLTVANDLAAGLDSRVRVDSMRATRGSVVAHIPHDASAVAAIRSWGVDVPKPTDFLGTGTRHYDLFVRRAGIERHVTVITEPYPNRVREVA